VTYTPGQAIQLNGWEITFTGVPQTGDTFTISSTSATFVARNSGNAAALLALRDMPLYDGATLTDGYAGLMGQLGVRTQSAKFAAEVSDAIATTVEKDRAGIAGVNLDEEAGKMLQYQQAYQAAGKALQIANNMFDTLMQSITR
jgi:flagellar hook-associated protein 1 FlgK